MKRVRLSTMSVLDMSFRAIGVRAGSFWARVACVPCSNLLLIVCIPVRAFVSRRELRCVFVAFCQLLSWSSGAAI